VNVHAVGGQSDDSPRPADVRSGLIAPAAAGRAALEQRAGWRPALATSLGAFRDWLMRGSPPALSARTRLTLWYTSVLAIMLTAFSVGVYWYMGTSLTRDMYRTSAERARQVQEILRDDEVMGMIVRKDPGSGNLVGGVVSAFKVEGIVDPFRDPGVGVRIFDQRGTLHTGSAEFLHNTDRIPYNRAATVAAIAYHMEHQEILATSEGPFYVYTRPAISRDERRVLGAVQILTSREPYERTMDRLASLLIAGTLVAVALAWGTGAALAQTVLAPIDTITRTAQRINRAQDLSRRVESTGPPDELRRLADTFNEMLDRVESLFDRQRQFLADVSHELRTPLTTLRGEIELMERTGVVEQEALEAMRSEAERMSRLVNDLLLLARADSGLAIERKPVQLDLVAEDLQRQATTLAGDSHRIEMSSLVPLTVIGDRDRLKQLGLILIDNAIKYTPPGTVVRIGTSPGPSGGAILHVADTGPGIAPAEHARIFDRLYRVDKARSRFSGGSGLGLSIAKWIAEAHGGSIIVESEPGRGSRFSVQLPDLSSADRRGATQSPDYAPGAGSDETAA
jgi:two-component system, OmpR family, sensor kinase